MSLLFQPLLAWFVPASLLIYWRLLTRPDHRRFFLAVVSLALLIYLVGTKAAIPLGISYLVFRALHYALGRYRGTIARGSFADLFSYLFFLPLLPAGPLEPYNSFLAKQSLTFDWPLFQRGLRRIVWGYFKKTFLVDVCLVGVLRTYWPNAEALDRPFLYVLLRFLQAYLDLSAYTDIAIGLSALFGFRIMENFGRPFLQPSVAKFWQHWHMSVTQWCRDHVFFPVLGYCRRPVLAIYASMLVMGLWHGLSLNWLAWGAYHATGIVASQSLGRLIGNVPSLRAVACHRFVNGACVMATLLYVILGFSFVCQGGLLPGLKLYLASIKNLVFV